MNGEKQKAENRKQKTEMNQPEILKEGPKEEMVPLLVEKAKTRGFVFLYQEPDGEIRVLSNLRPREIVRQFVLKGIGLVNLTDGNRG